MSAGEKRKTACVTGGNGYIASALIKTLLEKGYAVKTTVRNPDDMAKNSHLKDLQALGPLTVLRADLDEEGSFDDAVAGCDYAFLVAAPVNLASEDPEKELIEPAVRGTLNVMRSCVKAGTVKRVILTSSMCGVYIRPELHGGGHVLDEDSWSDVEHLRAQKPPIWWGYCVSKVLLEKAACAFAEEHGISLVTVCPVSTVGAAPAPVAHTSVPTCLSFLSGDEAGLGSLKGIEKTSGGVQLVHLEDLCAAEVFVAEEAVAAGRYICCSVNTTVVELARFLAHKYPQYGVKTDFSDDDQLLEKPRVSLSSAKLVREGFEFKYKTLDELYDDVVEYGKALGILPYWCSFSTRRRSLPTRPRAAAPAPPPHDSAAAAVPPCSCATVVIVAALPAAALSPSPRPLLLRRPLLLLQEVAAPLEVGAAMERRGSGSGRRRRGRGRVDPGSGGLSSGSSGQGPAASEQARQGSPLLSAHPSSGRPPTRSFPRRRHPSSPHGHSPRGRAPQPAAQAAEWQAPRRGAGDGGRRSSRAVAHGPAASSRMMLR